MNTNDELPTSAAIDGNTLVIRRCRSCRWWRDKGWADDEGIGICDNPKVIEQVQMMSEGLISRFVADQRDTRMIAQSLRFSSEFGCIHWSDNGG